MRTSPARLRLVAPAAAALLGLVGLLAVAGCGSEDSDGADQTPTTVRESSDDTSEDGSGGSGDSSSDQSQAVTVVYHKSGGLRPTNEQLVYSEDGRRPKGVSSGEVDAVLAAASDPALRELKLKPVPKYACCDLQEYTLTITYADGTTTSFRTIDGVQQPRLFEHLLSMLG